MLKLFLDNSDDAVANDDESVADWSPVDGKLKFVVFNEGIITPVFSSLLFGIAVEDGVIVDVTTAAAGVDVDVDVEVACDEIRSFDWVDSAFLAFLLFNLVLFRLEYSFLRKRSAKR